MTTNTKIIEPVEVNVLDDSKEKFKQSVLSGLSQLKKTIPSQYLYDANGSCLFDQITRHPDYYLSNCEIEILKKYQHDIGGYVDSMPFNLIELGPGEGVKTQILLDYFLQKRLNFSYIPIDVSKECIEKVSLDFNQAFPQLDLVAINSDFLTGLQWLKISSERRNVLLLLGSSIGNYTLQAAGEFLRFIYDKLNPGDYFLIGFDLHKDINMLLRAYNDADGLTREFNLNLLRRMNTELGANFQVNAFEHFGTYNVYSGAMESYLLSCRDQEVAIEELGKSFHFEAYEAIHVEYSHKYSLTQIAKLASDSGFKVVKNFTDSKHYFVDSLWVR